MNQTKQIQQPHNNKNQGNALVFALLVVSVTSMIAYALIELSTFGARRTAQLNNTDNCNQAVHAAEIFATNLLFQEPEAKTPASNAPTASKPTTTTAQDWAQPFEMTLSSDIALKAQISDLQGQFNVNSLTAQGEGAGSIYSPELIFTRLLSLSDIHNGQALQQAASYWVNSEITADDEVYLERTPAYRVAHLPLVSISELKLVQGFSPEGVEKLYPFISALPSDVKINVNTAPARVLAALLDSPVEAVESVIFVRQSEPFPSAEEFLNQARSRGIAIQDESALQNMIDVNSHYFLLKTEATCQQNTLISYSFIKRLSDGKAKVYQRTQEL